MSRTALLIVDLQNDYFQGGAMKLAGIDEASGNARRLLDHARTCRWPVFHLRHLSIRDDATFFLPDTPGSEIHASVAPREGEPVIIKHFPNSFRGTDLEKALRDQSVERLLVCGAMSHMCIDTTVRAAFDMGFSCLVAHDACATRDLAFKGKSIPAVSVHTVFMAALNGSFARVTSTDEILASPGMD